MCEEQLFQKEGLASVETVDICSLELHLAWLAGGKLFSFFMVKYM